MKITATMQEAKAMSGLGLTTLYALIGEGKLATVKVGRRRLVNVDSLHMLLKAA